MADFGVNATQLSAPQGAGANVVAPVEERAVSTSMIGALASVGDVITTGIKSAMKANAEQTKEAVVGKYVNEQGDLNKALASGSISPQEASSRSRALFTKYSGNYSGYIEDFGKAAAALKGYSELGTAEKAVETAADLRKSSITAAQSAGYQFFPGMSTVAEDAQLRAYSIGQRSRTEFEDQAKRNAERRAQGTYDRGIADQENRQTGIRVINDIAGSQLAAVREFGVSLGEQVRNNKITPEDAQARLMDRFTTINMALQSAAGVNPELAAPYRSIFGEVQKLSEQFIDPKANLANLTAQVDTLVNRQKLAALQDPTAAKTVAISQLFGNNAEILLRSAPAVGNAITKMFANDPDSGAYVPPIVGNPEVEKDAFKFLKSSMTSLTNGQYADNVKAKDEMERSVRHVLKQTADTIGRGASAKTLQEAASFFASPEYGKWSSENKIDPQEQLAAYRAFQLSYEPTVIKGVEKRLNEAFVRNTGLVPARAATGGELKPTMDTLSKDNFSVSFNGSGIMFNMKQQPTDPLEARYANEAIKAMKTSQDAVNQLVRIGAHMEGTTNYAKFWEENKHVYLPSFFSKYQGLEIGQVVDGMRYNGGDAKADTSWTKVK